MARLPMTLNEAENQFYVLSLGNTHNAGNIACLHINWKVHAACDLNFIVEDEWLLDVTGSHEHWKSGHISETVLDRDVATTSH